MKILKVKLIGFLGIVLLLSSCKKEETAISDPNPNVNTITSSKATINGSQFSSLYDHQSVVFMNKLWIIGGRSGNNSKNEIWTSSNGNEWTQVTPVGNFFGAINSHQVVVFKDKLWVIGGVNNGSGIQDIWSSSDGINWTKDVTNTLFGPRYNHEVAVFNNKLWLIGGDAGGVKNDIWSSPDGITWSQETAIGTYFSARAGHKVVVINNKMILIGGYSKTGFTNDVWSTSDGINWTEELSSGTKFLPMYAHEAVIFNDKIYVIGGQTGAWGTTTDEVWASKDGKEWAKQTIVGTSYGSRAAHQAILFNSKLYITGGYDSQAAEKNDVWTLY